MEYVDQPEQYRRLQELYAEMSDEEIEDLSGQTEDLTEIAQQVLRGEISKRRLGPSGFDSPEDPREVARRAVRAEKAEEPAAQQSASPDQPVGPAELKDSSHATNLWFHDSGLDPAAFDLVGIWNVTDAAEARRIMDVLEAAGIKAYLGPDDVESVDDYKGNYEDGVEIKVMKFQGRFALEGLLRLFPPPPEQRPPDDADYAIFCPICNSRDVVFQGLDVPPGEDPTPDAMYIWTCAECGHEWKDEGLQKVA